jgi:large subunit ribosomal protein L24
MIKLKVKKGDKVVVTTGKYKGKAGEILEVMPKKNKAIVAGVNIAKKHTKASQFSEGGIIQKEMPIDISNLSHIDPKTNQPTKIGYRTLEDGTKVRYAKKSGEILSGEGN